VGRRGGRPRLGTDTIALQASEMGFSLYAAMGFRTVVPYASFKRAIA